MISSNIKFLRTSLERGDPEYGILSLTADSFDAMRTYMSEDRLPEGPREEFAEAMRSILKSMETIDGIISVQPH